MKALEVQTALVLIAHGSREQNANADAFHLAAELKRRGPYQIVEVSFLELTEPTIHQAVQASIHAGAKTVILTPYFLSAGVHVRRDLTDVQTRLSEEYPEVHFRLAEPLGRHPSLIGIVLERAGDAGAR
jgi:sirohydrochlorin ferrochelatase